ncbi:unnamed protein product, partial [Coregonus sp. 'balchen']
IVISPPPPPLHSLTDGRSSTVHMGRSLAVDLSSSLTPLTRERKSSCPSPLFPARPVHLRRPGPPRRGNHDNHGGSLSNSAPQDYLLLHQCMSRKTESAR